MCQPVLNARPQRHQQKQTAAFSFHNISVLFAYRHQFTPFWLTAMDLQVFFRHFLRHCMVVVSRNITDPPPRTLNPLI
jgi:hypothetical protein